MQEVCLEVEPLGYEGIVVHTKLNDKPIMLKLKPEMDMDVVVVGIVKKGKEFPRGRGATLRVAVMVDSNTFLEIGDVASGLTIKDSVVTIDSKSGIVPLTANVSYLSFDVIPDTERSSVLSIYKFIID